MERLKPWEELSIQDNFLFQKLMQQRPDLCRELLELILDIHIIELHNPEAEKTIAESHNNKSIRLDVYAVDENGTVYDIEMQTSNKNDDPLAKRTRYYQGLIDLNILTKGAKYEALKKTCIIFICTFDYFRRGRSIYTFRNLCEEDSSLPLGDESYKIFLNTTGIKDDVSEDLKHFLDYVEGQEPEGIFTNKIAEAIKALKEHKETKVDYMTYRLEIERQRYAAEQEGIALGIEKATSNLNALNRILIASKRFADLERAANDTNYQRQLIQELLPSA